LSPSASIFSSSEITVTRVVTFEWPIVSEADNYNLISVSGCRYLENIGEPRLPVKNVFFLIPPAAALVDVEVASLVENTLKGEYLIFPAQPPLRTVPENLSFVPPDPLIYESSGRYPKKLFSLTKAGNLGGHRVLGIRIFPVQYVPKSGEIIFHSEISIKVSYSLDGTGPTDLASSAEFNSLVKRLVLNPESGDDYSSSVSESSFAVEAALPSNDVEYVIITSENLEDNFQVLADWKTKKGVPAKVVTVSWIADNYPGVDNQEKIRNFIEDAVENWGTTWVLLGGDTNIIPVRKGYGEVEGEAAGVDKDNIPADLYYSDLDGDWNADGDNTYGEVEDNVDLYPDVFVGRAPVDSVAEAQTFVDKTLKYERDSPAGYQKSVLFLAEILRQNPYTDGGIAKDVIDNGYIPDEFSITKLYESSGNLNHDTAMDNLNSGYGIVNHVGHANYSVLCVGPNNLTRSDMDSLTNSPEYSVFYSIGCWSAAMDRNSIGERFVLSVNGGGPVYVGNSRYGWFTPGEPGGGSSDMYDQEFFNSLLVENFCRVGETLADSKIEFIPESENDGPERWIQYALNLLGDPELPIWTEAPENLVVTHPSEILTGPRQVTVTVKDNDGSAVENALVCLQKDPDVYTYGYTDSSGEAVFSISPTSPGNLNVTVTKHNFLPYENALHVLAVLDISILPSENEGLPSEEVTFLVKVKNTGDTTDNYLLENVDNSSWILELENSMIEVPAGENRTTMLIVTIPEDAEPGIEDEITVTATSQENENISDNATCIVHVIPPRAELSLVTLHKVGLDLDVYLDNGSKLVVKFYTYTSDNQGENVVWENATPARVVLLENVPHPRGEEGYPWGTGQVVKVVLTTDNTDEVISEIASFTVHQGDLMDRYIEILIDWAAHPELHDAFRAEIIDILLQWSSAPP
jgi:hypothetical protein